MIISLIRSHLNTLFRLSEIWLCDQIIPCIFIIVHRQSFLCSKRFILRIYNYCVIYRSVWELVNIIVRSSWDCKGKKQFSFHGNFHIVFLIFFFYWLQVDLMISFSMICCDVKILFCNVAWLSYWSFLWAHSVVLLGCDCFLFDILEGGKGGLHFLNLVILSLYSFHLVPLNWGLVHLLLLQVFY